VDLLLLQASDGIREWSLTGVQTCALPISRVEPAAGIIEDRPDDARLVDGHRQREREGRLGAAERPGVELAREQRAAQVVLVLGESGRASCRARRNVARSGSGVY